MPLKSRRNKILLVSLLLLLALSVYFYKVVFFGRALSATDGLFTYPPYTSVTPAGWTRASNALLGDQTIMFYPFLHYARENIRQGHLPLWNPYIETGTPFLADAQSALFYPVNIVYYTLPFKDAFAVSAFLKLLIAGLGMFLFVETLGLEFAASLFSSLVFMFCSFNIVWLGLQNSNVSIFLPWLFFFAHRYMKTGAKRYLTGLTITTGIQFLGGHPETSAHILLAASLYLLILAYWDYRDKKRTADIFKKIAYAGTAFLLGFMIASPMLIPFLSILSKSVLWSSRGNAGVQNAVLPLSSFSTLFMPNFFGSPVSDTYWGAGNFNMTADYAGIITLILAGIAIVMRRKERTVLWFSFLALGVLLVVYSIPPFARIFNMLPFYDRMANYGLLLIFQFSAAVLAGIGIDTLAGTHPEQKMFPEQRAGMKNGIQSLSGTTNDVRSRFIKKTGILVVGIIIVLAIISILVSLVMNRSASSAHIDAIFNNFYVLLLKTGLFLMWLWFYQSARNKRPVLILLILIAFFDLYYFGHTYNPQVPKEWVYPRAPEPIAYMEKDKSLFRFVSLGATYIPDTLMVYHLSDVRGYDWPGNIRYDRFFRTCLDNKPYFGIYIIGLKDFYNKSDPYTFVIPENIIKLFRLLNVKYVGGIDTLYSFNDFRQRAYLVHNIIPASSPDKALSLVKTDIDDLLNDSVVIEGNGGINLPACPDKSGDYANIVSYHPDTVDIMTSSKCQSVLVLSDMYDKGWEVRVDGKRQQILHADYLFRGVLLEPGQHHIVFEYKPFSFTLGLILSAAGILAVIGIAWL